MAGPVSTTEEFERHWMKAQASVSAFVHSMVRDYHEAEDIFQEVAIVLAGKFEEYDATRPFTAWAIGFARNRVLSAWKKHSRSPILYDSEVIERIAAGCETLAEELDRRTPALRRCMEAIGGRSRRILGMRYEEGLKPRHIAERLKMKASAIRAVLFRIRQALRRCMQETFARQEIAL